MHNPQKSNATSLAAKTFPRTTLLWCCAVFVSFFGCGAPTSHTQEASSRAEGQEGATPSESTAPSNSQRAERVNLSRVNTTAPNFENDALPFMKQVCAECHYEFTFQKGFERHRESMLKAVRGQKKIMPPSPEAWKVPASEIPAYKAALEAVLSNYEGK